MRLFGIDIKAEDPENEVVSLSRLMCFYLLRKSHFLTYKPSQKAAAAIILSINICLSPTAKIATLNRMNKDKLQSQIFDALTTHADSNIFEDLEITDGPLSIWNK